MHTIRLREPWQSQWLEAPQYEGGSCIARYDRKFNCPTGIDDAVVALCIAPVAAERDEVDSRQFSASLNDCSLTFERSAAGHWSALITELLQPFNRLVLHAQLIHIAPACASPPSLDALAQVSLRIGLNESA